MANQKLATGKNVRTIDTLLRDHFDYMRHMSGKMSNDDMVTWNARLTELLEMKAGRSEFTLTATVKPIPVNERGDELLVYKVTYTVDRSLKREAKNYLKTAFALNFFPNGMATEEPGIIKFSIYNCTKTQAAQAMERSQGLLQTIEVIDGHAEDKGAKIDPVATAKIIEEHPQVEDHEPEVAVTPVDTDKEIEELLGD